MTEHRRKLKEEDYRRAEDVIRHLAGTKTGSGRRTIYEIIYHVLLVHGHVDPPARLKILARGETDLAAFAKNDRFTESFAGHISAWRRGRVSLDDIRQSTRRHLDRRLA